MKNVPLQNAPAVLRHAETPVSCLAALQAFLSVIVTTLMILNKVVVEWCWSDPARSLQTSSGDGEPDVKAVPSTELGVQLTDCNAAAKN